MKTKALISFAVTAKLICVFIFAYAKCWFSHDVAHILLGLGDMAVLRMTFPNMVISNKNVLIFINKSKVAIVMTYSHRHTIHALVCQIS